MNDWQEGLGNLHVATFCDGGMKIPSLSKRRVTAPVVGDQAEDGYSLGNALDAWRRGESASTHAAGIIAARPQ